MAKEGGGIKNITPSGSGNAVTDMSLSSDGKTITVVFGEVFAKQQDLGTLNNTVTQLSNKLNDFLEGSDTDNIINKWKELESFLEGLTESDNLADLLALKADKTITISAGAGLTGGGNLSANRTISLATSGVKAGTYTKVTVDTYGRVTVGDNPTTLAGYGITDAYTQVQADKKFVTLATDQAITGNKTFTNFIRINDTKGLSYSGNTVFRNSSGNTVISSFGDGMIYFRPNGDTSDDGVIQINKQGYLNGVAANFTGKVTAAQFAASDYVQIGDAYLKWDAANNAVYVVKKDNTTPIGFYATSFVSAKGIQQGGSSEGGAIKTVYSFANLTDGTTFSDTDLNNTFNAYTIKKIYDMAGQGGLDATAMWNELKKADSSKVIDASHIPTSVLDGRWVKKAGDTMTGDLAMDTNKGFYIPHGTRVVKTSGNWIHGGGDTASSTDANLRFASWNGIGWYPTIDSTSGVRQGNNAMWLNVRTGVLDVHSNITSHNGYLAANWDSARRLVLGGGSYTWIDSRDSSNNVLCNIGLYDNKVVIGNYAESRRFVSTVGKGTQPYQCSSTTLNSNLNADLLDGYHQTSFNMGWTSATKYRLDRWGGSQDKNWKKIVTYINTGGGQYRACKVKGTIYFITGNHNQAEVVDIPFEAIMYAYGGTADSMLNQSTLYLPIYCGWDLIRIVRYANNSWEVQVRQPSDWTTISFEYTAIYNGGSMTAGQFANTTYTSRTVANSYNTNVSRPTTSRAGYADKLTTGRTINGTTFDGTANITTLYWGTTRTFYTNSHDSYRVSSGVNVNGSGNVTLLLPNSIRCSDWFRSTGNTGWYHENYGGGWYMTDSSYIRNYNSKRLRIQTDTYDTIQLVRTSGSGGSSIAFYNGGGTFRGQFGMNATSWFTFDTGTATANQNVVEISPAGGIHSKAEITAKASGSDIRLKKDIQNYNAMDIINKFRSVKYHWNDVAKANSEVYNNDYDQFGLIAQDLIAGGFKQWVRDVFHDYYTVTYERLIPVVWKGLQEVDDEVTRLKKRVRELENRLGIYNQ